MSQESRLKLSDIGRFENAFALAEITGIEVFEKIVDAFGGSAIYIPVKRQLYREKRERDIVKKYSEGASVQSLAHEYDISTAWVCKIIRDSKARDGLRK